ncbi:Alpha/Beta hydrolase protein [Rhexocercosporidium sp. MPI-PUGE-AT-0058]|nr:Alpha/Beta hydrolase protein [Rhexocercosporidium sp. MPI-PUGE-AT-0058]
MSTSPENYKQVLTSAGHTYNYYSSASPKSKTTILFIHGAPYTAKIWRHQVTHFEKLGFGCIVPDILGHGKTSKPSNPAEYALPVAAKSMMDILDEEGVDKAVVVGHDWGSAIATRIALLFTVRVQALVMVCVPYFTPGPFDYNALNDMTEQAFGAACFGYWDVFLNSPELLTEHAESFHDGFFAKDKTHWVNHFTARGKLREWLLSDARCEVKPEIEEADHQDFFANDFSAVMKYYHCFAQGHNTEAEKDITGDAQIITVPSLMVAATDDGCSPLPFVQSTMEGLQDGKIVIIDGDHHIFLEQQKQFNSELETFFAEKGVKHLL